MVPHSWLLFSLVILAAAAQDKPGRKWTTEERIQPQHLQAVHEARIALEKVRKPQPDPGVYQDFPAVIHVHAEDSNHTRGTRQGVLEAAKATGTRVVLLTDHNGPKPETWKGLREGVLFLAGSEEKGLTRFPPLPGTTATSELRFLCHLEEQYEADSKGFAGMEIYNRHTDEKDEEAFSKFLRAAIDDNKRWSGIVENFQKYPDEFFAAGADYWPAIFSKWDHELENRRFSGMAANDSHENQIFNGTKFDPYTVSFRNVRTHILARELTDEAIRKSLVAGHSYVSHDWLCDPQSFSFTAVNNLGVFTMGDPVPLTGSTRLNVQTPVPAQIKFIHKGKTVKEESGTRVTLSVKEPGAYRVEAWLNIDGEDRPWIYSNPIYLQPVSLADIPFPLTITATNVQVTKDIEYAKGVEEDTNKHKLDVYSPKTDKPVPVFLFVHGGAWRSGDRSLYPSFGNRFAREGMVVVIPSYRLAPKNPFPAQIDDVAAALAWTVQHMAEFGGDTNRIFVGGHSAGGHLSALLALDEKYLTRHGLAPNTIKGAIPLSGVFDVLMEGRDSRVFGKDPELQKDASPIRHIGSTGPLFLVAYCEWDYFPLAAQAQEFHAALQKAGLKSDLLFEPQENHISEVLAFLKPGDLVGQAIVRFVLGQNKN